MAKSVDQSYFVTFSIDEHYSGLITAPSEEEAKLKMLKIIVDHDMTLKMLAALYPALSQKLLACMTVEDRTAICQALAESATNLNASISKVIAKAQKIPFEDYVKYEDQDRGLRRKLDAVSPRSGKRKDIDKILTQCEDLLYIVRKYHILPSKSEE